MFKSLKLLFSKKNKDIRKKVGFTLFGLLRPGDTMLSITGAPYDTLQTIIKIL